MPRAMPPPTEPPANFLFSDASSDGGVPGKAEPRGPAMCASEPTLAGQSAKIEGSLRAW